MEEKDLASADNNIPERDKVFADALNGGAESEENGGAEYFPEAGDIDLSACSDEELEEIVSGRLTLEDYMARHSGEPVCFCSDETREPEPYYEPVADQSYENTAAKGKKSKKKIIIPIVIVLFLCVAAAVAVLLLNGETEAPIFNADEYAFAYAKNNTVHIASYLSKGVLEGSEESAVRFSRDRRVAVFSKVHESNRYKDDLYFCDIRNQEEVSAGGVQIDNSVVEFYVTPDGRHVIYTKAKEKQMDAYCYSIKNRSAVKLDSGIHDFYIPEDRSDRFFYTKSNGSSSTIYRYDIDEHKTEAVLKGAGEVTFISDENGSFLFAELDSETEGCIDLYRVEYEGEAQKVLSDVLSVLYDEFLPGGSLYFMRSAAAGEDGKPGNYSFDAIINDDKAEADAALTEPDKDDYAVSVFGFKSYDYLSYNAAKSEYKKKQERDKIREALEKGIEKEALNGGDCSCCAYDFENKTETVVCENVPANGIVAVNKQGAPRVVFTRFRVIAREESEPITIDEAVSASKSFRGSLEDYLKSLVSETTVPDGLALSVNSGGSVGAEEIKEYSAETTAFFFADKGSRLIALIRDEVGEKNSLVSMILGDEGISVINPIDTNVMQVIPAKKGFYYLRVDSGRDNGDLFYYPDAGTEGARLLSVVEQVILCEDGNLLAEHKSNGAPMLSLCVGGTVDDIDTDVKTDQIAYYSEDCIAYVKNSGVGAGDLYLYNGKNSPVAIDSGVSKIFTDKP